MGGGHVSRPDFGMPQPDAAYPLTEFYLLAQQALEKAAALCCPPSTQGCKPLPGASTGRRPPGICSLRQLRQRA